MNAPAKIGHNNPPVDPFDAISADILDLFELAESALTGEPIANQAQADQINQIAKDALKAGQAADSARKDEKRPHDEAAKAVQAKWTPLITKAELARSTALKALTPWNLEIQRQKDEAAAKARAEAEALAEAARKVAQEAAASADLSARAEAEILLKEADKATKTANKIERGPTGLRTYWHAEITDRRAALNHIARIDPEALSAFIDDYVRRMVASGARVFPGTQIMEEKRAV